ncbi:hypothetical protein LVD15_25045 [Fulvivirga maritima]|uniref:DUF1302 family protein n=1 Tax=Fulvivirga maritima TaxID=2904247 RepID=UPI001F15EC15|nr:DUF1302 family protein [Fulvivirga maritima]UII26524.1 hypothetical protein LVD15_25045 [Fulvivirga maritima]
MKYSIREIRRGLTGLLLIFTLPAAAQNMNTPLISGFTEIDHISYFNHDDSTKTYGRNQGILQLELSGSDKNISYFGAIEFRNDISNPDRNRIWTDELYISYKAKNYDLHLGKKIYTWGSTDFFSPVNIVNPIDYSDLLDTDNETIRVYSANIKYYWNNFYLDAVFMPVFQPTVIPPANSPWYPELPTSLYVEGEQHIPIRYTSMSSEPIENDIRSSQFAVRLGGSAGSIDFNLNYFKGYDDIPFFHKNMQLTSDTMNIAITEKYHKLSMIGIDFSTVVGGMVLKGEYAYNNQEAPADQDWYMGSSYHYAVIGIDKNVSDIVGEADLFFTMQYIYQHINTDYEVNSFNYNHIFQNALMTNFDLAFNQRLKLEATSVYDFKEEHYVIIPEISYKPEGSLIFQLKTYLTGGNSQSLYGSYDNNRIQFMAKYHF